MAEMPLPRRVLVERNTMMHNDLLMLHEACGCPETDPDIMVWCIAHKLGLTDADGNPVRE